MKLLNTRNLFILLLAQGTLIYPGFGVPVIRLPEIRLPKINRPDFRLPSLRVPSFNLPHFPSISLDRLSEDIVRGLRRGAQGLNQDLEQGMNPLMQNFSQHMGEMTRQAVTGARTGFSGVAGDLEQGMEPVARALGRHIEGLAQNGGNAARMFAQGGGDAMHILAREGGDAMSDAMHTLVENFRKEAVTAGTGVREGYHVAIEGITEDIVAMTNELGHAGSKQLLKLTLAGMGTTVALGLTYYAGKKYIAKYMYEPKLIQKSSSRNPVVHALKSLFIARKPIDAIIKENMVISEQLASEMQYIMQTTSNVKLHGGNFENVLLYGEPGTGKTLFAELLAQYCGMDYAIIPAANVSQFLANGRAVEELNALFEWAAKNKRGTILFFDECEVFLKNRNKLSDAAHNALSAFLTKTGTPSNRIMIICATNIPEALDSAVVSRLGMRLNFPLPDLSAREKQLIMHINKVFGVQKKGSFVEYEYLEDMNVIRSIAERLEGSSGRTIQKFVNRLRQRALSENILDINAEIVDKVIQQVLRDKQFEQLQTALA